MGDSSYVTYCRICNAKVPSDTSFCTECGQSLKISSTTELTCSSCGENLSEDYRFCPECGDKIESIGTCPRCTARIKPGTSLCTECGVNVYEYHSEDKVSREDEVGVKKKGQDSLRTSLMKGLGGSGDKNDSKRNPVQEKERYLVCNTCRGYYQLQKGEDPGDFSDECECGGKLRVRNSRE